VATPAPLKISVSGVRGIVGASLTPALVLRYALAFGARRAPGPIIVARDTRPSGVMLGDIVCGGLQAVGCRVIRVGVVPTPTALGAVLAARARGGIIVTASHNPAPWNGMKFVGAHGSCLTPPEMDELVAAAQRPAEALVPWHRLKASRGDVRAVEQHVARILRAVDTKAIRRRRFTVALDSCNGAGAVATPRLLKALGCRVVGIHVTPSGDFPRGPEPTPRHLAALAGAVRRAHAAVGFAQDPDADRLSLVDETGCPLSEELTVGIAVQHRLRQRRGPVVVNLSTSRIIDDVAGAAGVTVWRTPVGEVHVVHRMRQVHAVIGGEGNGGVIDPRVTWGRDSLAGIALVLEALAHDDDGQPLSAVAARLARWTMIKRIRRWSPSQTARVLASLRSRFRHGRITAGDGIRVDLPEGWVHVRPSNTEPVVRVFAEATTAAQAERLYRQAVA